MSKSHIITNETSWQDRHEILKSNGIKSNYRLDYPIKVYGVFLTNSDTKSSNLLKKFLNETDADAFMEIVKNNREKYVEKDGNYLLEIKLMVELGDVESERTLAYLSGIHTSDKRIDYIV